MMKHLISSEVRLRLFLASSWAIVVDFGFGLLIYYLASIYYYLINRSKHKRGEKCNSHCFRSLLPSQSDILSSEGEGSDFMEQPFNRKDSFSVARTIFEKQSKGRNLADQPPGNFEPRLFQRSATGATNTLAPKNSESNRPTTSARAAADRRRFLRSQAATIGGCCFHFHDR